MLNTSDSGILNILLYNEGIQGDSQEVIEELQQIDGVVNYIEVDDFDLALQEVKRGKADSLWVFPDHLKEEFLEYQKTGKAFIKVYLKEDNIQTKIVREQLFGNIYPKISYYLLDHFFEEHNNPNRSKEFQELLDGTYESFHHNNQLLEFAYIDGTTMENTDENYLTMPLRGMLAIFLLIISMSVSMFYLQDQQEKIFLWMPIKNRALFPFFYILTGSLNGAVLTLISLRFSGSFTNWKNEILIMLIYLFAVNSFSNLLILIFRNIKTMGAAILIISLVSLLLCPVFFNLNRFPLIQFLLPPYYYLGSIYNSDILFKMLLYSVITFILGYLINLKAIAKA